MTTEQDIRTALVDEAAAAPQRQGSLAAVLTRGRRRRRGVRAAHLIGSALAVAALIGVPVTLLSDGPVDVSEVDGRGQIEIAGELFPIGEALETLGGSPVYASVPGPEPRFDTQRLGVEFPFQLGTPNLADSDLFDGPAVYIGTLLSAGETSEETAVALLEGKSGGVLGIGQKKQKCLAFSVIPFAASSLDLICADVAQPTPIDAGGAMWNPIDAGGAMWIGVPEGTAVVSVEVDGAPTVWQQPRSRIAIISFAPTQAPSSVRVVALDEDGREIAVIPVSAPVEHSELLYTFESGGIVYQFRAFPNQQGPDAPCVGVTTDLSSEVRSTMGCPTEQKEATEYAARISLGGAEFLVGYGLQEGETIQIPDAIHTFISDEVDGRRFFITQIPQAPNTEPITIEILTTDGTTRNLNAHEPNG
jgi:hypothetical protein